MKRMYEPFLELDFDLILNGHNPKAIDREPKGAMEKVIAEGTYEIYGENCTFLWVDLNPPVLPL